MAELKALNEALWQIEDGIRQHERTADFGADIHRTGARGLSSQ